MSNKNVVAVIDGAAGSCGKAKVIGEIVTDKSLNIKAAITSNMPNAGHTFVDEAGHKTVFRNIPVSIINPNAELFISASSEINMVIFKREYEKVKDLLNGRKIYVHECVPLIEERHIRIEQAEMKTGSTMEGCWSCYAEKVMRNPSLNFFQGYKDAVVISNEEWLDRVHSHYANNNELIILEGAQGCDLSLNYSGNHPYTTGRNVSVPQMLADAALPYDAILEVIMAIRPYPIRINDVTKAGDYIYTGGYGNGHPLTWSQINIACAEHTIAYHRDLEDNPYGFTYHLDEEVTLKVIAMYKQLPPKLKKQVLRENYPNLKVDLLTFLEIERLFYKINNVHSYFSIIISKDGHPYNIYDISEQTTVTASERKIFELDITKLKNNVRINHPTGLYLNFFEQLDSFYAGITQNWQDLYLDDPRGLETFIDWLESETGVEIVAFGTGKRNNERIFKRDLVRRM